VKRYEVECELMWNEIKCMKSSVNGCKWIWMDMNGYEWMWKDMKWSVNWIVKAIWNKMKWIVNWVWKDMKLSVNWCEMKSSVWNRVWMDVNGYEWMWKIWNEFQCVIRTDICSVSRILVCDASANWGKQACSLQSKLQN
jgi:hypothetical protein